ncbi:NnrS family protein [Sedimentitalea sp. JM2-8]|uniref:NnrS family protein n=1 Tax=Sedimentitalea xiamensis TaxID=3050037 RepID=A0ABT7FHI9_9RHOB|nr:NnrS family protein [Sedimentitalea xiamensis]MDK3074586.1 NnrS family protein [Sedimentitalea xiamensis]
MMATARNQTGPRPVAAFLSLGFRPFFLMGAIWAALAMAIWVLMLTGRDILPTALDPVSWHAHAFLFGYLGAVLAGFLLTAVPNWTGRAPLTGAPLAGLAGLWLLGRLAVAVSATLPWTLVMGADLAFFVALMALLLREIVAGRNWKNLMIVALVLGMTLANALFHLDAARGGYPAVGAGLRLGLAVAVLLIALIGGRIVPAFTRNWLMKRPHHGLPAAAGKADAAVLLLTLLALGLWVTGPDHAATAAACALAAAAQSWRLSRWAGTQTRSEALVWVLHAGYAFVPLGFLAVAAGILLPTISLAAQHVWMAGAVGLMTLAVMTRASLGHAGRPLQATGAIATLYLALILSVLARFAAGLFPAQGWLLHLAAGAWIVAFGGFALIYWPILTRPRPGR